MEGHKRRRLAALFGKEERNLKKTRTDGQGGIRNFLYKENTVGHVFALPFIFGFVCFSLIPIVTSFYYAFTDFSLGSKTADLVGFKNFIRLFQDEVFLKSLWVTVKYVFFSVPLKLGFALFVAFLLTRKSGLVTLYRSLYYVPSLVGGSVAVILVWKQLFARKGLINTMLGGMGLSTVNWFGDQALAIYRLFYCPLYVVVCIQKAILPPIDPI